MTAERQNHTGDITLSIPSDERHIYLVEIVISYLVKEIGYRKTHKPGGCRSCHKCHKTW